MKLSVALDLFGLNKPVEPETLKSLYKGLMKKVHPDLNPNDPTCVEKAKLLNIAYAILIKETGKLSDLDEWQVEVLSKIQDLDINIEIAGTWIWCSGNTFAVKSKLKEAGFIWASAKKMWFAKPPNYKSFSKGDYTWEEIREKHGSKSVKQSSNRPAAGLAYSF